MQKAGGKLPEDTDPSVRPMCGLCSRLLKPEQAFQSVKIKQMHEDLCAWFIKLISSFLQPTGS